MCCNSGDCNCGCETLVIPSIAGPQGIQGPAGTTVLVWSNSTLSTPTTGSDVLLYTYSLAANQLATNGDELEIVIVGTFLNNASRYIKLDLNSSAITTISNSSGILSNGSFITTATITRVSNKTTTGFSLSHWNTGSTTQSLVGLSTYTADFASIQTIKIYVNQDVASSIRIDNIKIKKSII